MSVFKNKYGCWVIGSTAFDSKYDALRFANLTNQPEVKFYYHDHVWSTFDKTTLGKNSLTSLYKQRALQLREKYSHLVLHYSGGSDSHNILHTFLSNGIKLDEISVRWAKPLRDGKFYSANISDTSAKNAASEWDYSIKPTLDYITSHHPEIKITLVDFTERLNLLPTSVEHVEKTLLTLKMYRGALGSFVQRFDPLVETNSSIKKINKNVGHIFGIEKPMLTIKDNKVYLRFSDAALETSLLVNNMIENTAELFYWSPELPELPLEQAFQVASFFKSNPQYLNLLWSETFTTSAEASLKTNAQSEIVKKILYGHSWDFSRFQVSKPNEARSDWWHWVHNSNELSEIKQSYITAMKNITSDFDPRMLIFSENTPILRPLATKLFYITTLDN